MSSNEERMDPKHIDIAQIFLRPELYPHQVDSIEHVQTHISHVFLTGSYAYKLKKPLDLGFLDFSSLERRMHFCQEELRLNQRLARDTYLQVLGLVRDSGEYCLEPLERAGGRLLEPVLQMRQMDRSRQMDLMLAKGQVTPEHITDLAHLLGDFYLGAERGWEVAHFGRPAQVRFNVEENFNQTSEYQGVTVAAARWRAIRGYSLGFMDSRQELLGSRVREGFIVDGHGDLHSGNINLPAAGSPIVFDCIEFNQRFRYQDVACDLAFLAMDLDYHGYDDLSEQLVSEFITCTGDHGLQELIPFYKCYRAVVRAKVFGFEFKDQTVPSDQKFTDLAKAKRYFRLAALYAELGGTAEPPFFLVCLMGLMGTGKTYLARILKERLGWKRISSDETRKRIAGLNPQERSEDGWEQGLYASQSTQDTYDALLEYAQDQLAMGQNVIVDASFHSDAERRRFGEMAKSLGAKSLFIKLKADRQVVAERLLDRQAKGTSSSDGRLELYDRQAAAWENLSPKIQRSCLPIDGNAPAEEKLNAVMRKLEEMGHAN
jgi:aminoglycoside phosphotransferase family enzyme/predicted kinase